MKKISFILILWMALSACEKEYMPKPKGYNRIDLPPHAYVSLPDTMPYIFEYSKHAIMKPNESWLTERYWIDIIYPEMEASFEISYKPVMHQDSLLKGYYSDSYRLTSQHNVKAYSIEPVVLELPNGDFATVTTLEGEIPSPYQFNVSDSSVNFLHGAVYFQTATKNDSLAPVIAYLKEDLIHMLETLEWIEPHQN